MLVRGTHNSFARSPDVGVSRAPNFNKILLGWLDEKLQTSETLYPLLAQLSQDSATLQGKDERVRDFMNVADRNTIYTYLALGSTLSSIKLAAEVSVLHGSSIEEAYIETLRHQATESVSQLFNSGLGGVSRSLHEKIDELEKARGDSLPPWWKEWEQRESGTREHVPQKQS